MSNSCYIHDANSFASPVRVQSAGQALAAPTARQWLSMSADERFTYMASLFPPQANESKRAYAARMQAGVARTTTNAIVAMGGIPRDDSARPAGSVKYSTPDPYAQQYAQNTSTTTTSTTTRAPATTQDNSWWQGLITSGANTVLGLGAEAIRTTIQSGSQADRTALQQSIQAQMAELQRQQQSASAQQSQAIQLQMQAMADALAGLRAAPPPASSSMDPMVLTGIIVGGVVLLGAVMFVASRRNNPTIYKRVVVRGKRVRRPKRFVSWHYARKHNLL